MGATDAIIKQLIDSLTTTLSQLTVEIRTIAKALDQASDERRALAEKVSQFRDVPESLGKLMERLDQLVQCRNDLQVILKDLQTIKTSIEPVSKLSNLLYKPLAVVVLAISLVAAFFWLEDNVKKFISSKSSPEPTTIEQIQKEHQHIHDVIGDTNKPTNVKSFPTP